MKERRRARVHSPHYIWRLRETARSLSDMSKNKVLSKNKSIIIQSISKKGK